MLNLKNKKQDFPGGIVVKNPHSLQGMWIQSLVRKLRFHMLQGS